LTGLLRPRHRHCLSSSIAAHQRSDFPKKCLKPGYLRLLRRCVDHGQELHEIRIVQRLLEIADGGETRNGRSIARLSEDDTINTFASFPSFGFDPNVLRRAARKPLEEDTAT